MADSRIYLSVPYTDKDAAKSLGASWDPVNKKWYVPANIDIALFAKWQSGTPISESSSTTTSSLRIRALSSKVSSSERGLITYPADKNFVAYNGDKPPWD
jgi:hypothetical protein